MERKTFKLNAHKAAQSQVSPKPIVHFGTGERDSTREFPFSDQDFFTLADLIHSRTGIVVKEHKRNMVYGRLVRRLRALGVKSFSDYLHYLAGVRGEAEIGFLINAMTTNLTRFFREDHHFDHLGQMVLPEFRAKMIKSGCKRLRIWSAGCSSGEEPYSIAMVLDAYLQRHRLEDVDAKILATDLDSNMLETGRKGDYSADIIDHIPAQYRTYLHPGLNQKDTFHVANHLRNYISFKQLNLISDWPLKGPFDAIFCRNVMIYFDNPTKAEIARKFAKLLKPGGWLFLGHSETLLDTDGLLDLYGRTVYRRID